MRIDRILFSSGGISELRGWVHHGYVEVGSSILIKTPDTRSPAKIVAISVEGLPSEELLGGCFADITLSHGAEVPINATQEICDPESLDVQLKWEQARARFALFGRASKLRDCELFRLRQQLLANLEILCSRGTPRQFEVLITELLNRQGFSTKLTPPTNDGGRDVECQRDGESLYVECKLFAPTAKVGRPHIQKLVGAMAADGIKKGIFAATCGFTAQAREYAVKAGIEVWDIYRLSDLLDEWFPEKIQPLIYNAMCLECGKLVEFALKEAFHRVKTCPNGHSVEKTISIKDAMPDATPP
jgi:hypothetical protein